MPSQIERRSAENYDGYDELTAILVSFMYLPSFIKLRQVDQYRNWALDSGAFTAMTLGKKIDLQKYMETCKELLATDPTLHEVFALDVIGDHKASAKNTEKMWAEGIPAIPTYHVGSPGSELVRLAKEYPKIALGGAVGYKRRDEWAKQCFAKVWPKKIHGLGFAGNILMELPWHSTDASSWRVRAAKFGRWHEFGYGGIRAPLNFRSELEHYQKLERQSRTKWAEEMKELGSPTDSPTVRLVVATWAKEEVATFVPPDYLGRVLKK